MASGGLFWSALRPIPLTPHSLNASGNDRWNRASLLALDQARYCTTEALFHPLSHRSLTRQMLHSERLGNSREVMLYRPRMAQPARGMLLLFDEKTYQDEYHNANLLDGLIALHLLPPVNVVFIDSLDHARRAKELPPNADFADFMAHELLPWLRQQEGGYSDRKRC